MIAKVFKIAGLAVLGLTLVGFASEAIDEIREEETDDTIVLDKVASFSRKIVKKGFEKDKNDVLLIKNKYNEMKAKDPDAAKEAVAWGLAAGGAYYAGLFTYKIMKRRKCNA